MLGRSTGTAQQKSFIFFGGKQCPASQLAQLSEIPWCVTLALRLGVACDRKKETKMQGKKIKKSPQNLESSVNCAQHLRCILM